MARNDDPTTDETAEDNPMKDAPLQVDAILGTKTYEDVLFSEEHAERVVPVDARTGNRTRVIEGAVEKAKEFVADDSRRVAVPQSTEATIETGSAPYLSVVFYDSKVVRGKIESDSYGEPSYENDGYGLEWTYRAATKSDEYDVEFVEADYETGNVTIRVEEVV
ncbi:hypothetical protein [Halococcus sp. IIIV-5B]|uniref:hypothetical protein n=1 Tax=Halococcus sp. IIIV-5B TaxID=2321230 RepID=UPI001F3ED490|nr:hypothetical protein [Halococcus sp. IIIV-5B]